MTRSAWSCIDTLLVRKTLHWVPQCSSYEMWCRRDTSRHKYVLCSVILYIALWLSTGHLHVCALPASLSSYAQTHSTRHVTTYMDTLTLGSGLWVNSKKESWLSFTGLLGGGLIRLGAACSAEQLNKSAAGVYCSNHSCQGYSKLFYGQKITETVLSG